MVKYIENNSGVNRLIREVMYRIEREYGENTWHISFSGDKRDIKNAFIQKIKELEEGSKPATTIPSATAVPSDAAIPSELEYLFSSKIFSYRQISITQADLNCQPDKLSPFIQSFFRILGKDSNELADLYQGFAENDAKNFLKKYAAKVNKEIPEQISKRFNDMYFCGEDEEYSFELDLESNRVEVCLYRGDAPLILDNQSTGFRWFFDFFFNFVYNEDLTPGSIIVMDEPATNLHVSGQIELRKFLKELAKKNGLTFVISTHSPFLIDCDHLDELRLMQRDDQGHVRIENRFDMTGNDADKFDIILNGLTVGRHVMAGSKYTVFVEGITDYSYLTAFKLLLSKENPEYEKLFFLPVGGITKRNKAPNKQIIDALCEIDKDPILLVDGDGAGKAFKEIAEGTKLTVFSLSDDTNSKHKVIEDLFSKEDGEKYNVKSKDVNESIMFKRNIFENEISDETKKNFKEVLDKVMGG